VADDNEASGICTRGKRFRRTTSHATRCETSRTRSGVTALGFRSHRSEGTYSTRVDRVTAMASAPAAGSAAASAYPGQVSRSVVSFRLVNYLAGHCLRTALIAVEDALGPWVKDVMAKHFPDTPEDVELAASARATANRRAELEVELKDLKHQLRRAAKAHKENETRQAIAAQKQAVVTELNAIRADLVAAHPVPRWVAECRMTAGRKMAPHIHADNRWDTHIIVVVMQAHLKAVFAPFLPDHFYAKEMLTKMDGLFSARFKRAHRVELVETDVLGALDQAATVLRHCHDGGAGPMAAKALHVVTTLLDEAKQLVDIGRNGTTMVCTGPALSVDECNAQLFYDAVTTWEAHVEGELGTSMHYQDGKIAFGDQLNPTWIPAVKRCKNELAVVAQARHWYFHHLDGDVDLSAVYDAMAAVTKSLSRGRQSPAHTEWTPPFVANRPMETQLTVGTPSPQATVAVSRVREIVGREAEIGTVLHMVVPSDGAPGTRVLIHGPPGVGKDTVMAEVAHSARVHSLGGLQGWLQASSDVVFRRQLLGLFGVHRPVVVAGSEDNEQAAIQAIQRWLSSNADWVLFVEDASRGTTTLWETLPRGPVGRVVVTSQQELHEVHSVFGDNHLELAPITTDDSLEMFRRMNVFSRKAPPPLDGESEDILKARCCGAGAPQLYVAPHDNERPRERKQRRRAIEIKLFEHTELLRPEFRSFLKDTLGNLPLSVSLCGHMIRADPSLSGVLDLIALYAHLDLDEVDRVGTNPQQDTHYFGLQLSIRINLDRLIAAADVAEEDRQRAIAVLAAMSMLDHTLTPTSLLIGHDMATIWGEDVVKGGLSEEFVGMLPAMAVFMEQGMLHQARDTCVRYGLLRRGNSEGTSFGSMHQQVQMGLRRELVAGMMAGQVVARAVRRMLCARFTFHQDTRPSDWQSQRALVPCVSAWCAVVTDTGAQGHTRATVVPEDSNDARLLTNWGMLALIADGNAVEGEAILSRGLCLLQRIRPPGHDDLVSAMNNVAAARRDLGKSDDGLLQMKEHILEQRRFSLDPDDPDIGVSMCNLMTTYYDLGRFSDAAQLGEETVSFMQRVHPEDHPHIWTSMSNLAAAYTKLDRHKDALQLKEKVLEWRRRMLPAEDPDIASSMSNLAFSYHSLGRHDKALQLAKDAIALQRQVLSENHPDLAGTMGNLASIYYSLARYDDALQLEHQVFTIRKEILPADHPDIALSMNNLMTNLSELGRLEEAAQMGEGAVAMRKRLLSPGHPLIASSERNLVTVYSKLAQSYDEHHSPPVSNCTARHGLVRTHCSSANSATNSPTRAITTTSRLPAVPPMAPVFLQTSNAELEVQLVGCLANHCLGTALVAEEEGRGHGVGAVLAAMSMLDCAMTPESLLSDHNASTVFGNDIVEKGFFEEDALHLVPTMTVFMDGHMLCEVQDLCVQCGLMRPGAPGDGIIGIMHPHVQVFLRQRMVVGTAAGQAVAKVVRRMLLARFTFDESTPPTAWSEQRTFVPGVSAWCDIVSSSDREGCCAEGSAVLEIDVGDIVLFSRWGSFVHIADGDSEGAVRIWSAGLAVAKRTLVGVIHPQTTCMTQDLAALYTELGQYDDLRCLEEDLLESWKQASPSNDAAIATAMSNLAMTYLRLGRHDEAARLGKESLALRQRVLPPDHPDVATAMDKLASTFTELGLHDDALKLREDSVRIQKQALSVNHPQTAVSMNNLVTSYYHLGRHEDAARLGEETVAIMQRVLPADHPDSVQSMSNLAAVYTELRRHDNALPLKQDVLALRKRILPPSHPDIAASMNNLVTTYYHLGRFDDAARLSEEALKIMKEVLPPDHPDIAIVMTNLASVYSKLGRHSHALRLEEDVLESRMRELPVDHPHIATSMNNLMMTYYHLKRYDDAAHIGEKALAIRRRVLPPDHLHTCKTMKSLAALYKRLGRNDDAIVLTEDLPLSHAESQEYQVNDGNNSNEVITAAAPTDAKVAIVLAAPAVSDTASTSTQVRLVNYLAGHCLRTALMAFEDVLGPWVKSMMEKHFADTPDDLQRASEYAATVATASAAAADKQKHRAELNVALQELEQQLRTVSKDQKAERKAIAAKKQSIVKQLKLLDKATATKETSKTHPVDQRWVTMCRKVAGQKTAPHIKADSRWDTHIIVVVMQAHLKDVFEPFLPDEFHAKEVLTKMDGLFSARFRRAHRVELVESDVLGALDQAATVLRQCRVAGAGPTVATALNVVTELLNEAKQLVALGRDGTRQLCTGPTLSAGEYNAQLFYDAVTTWEAHVERELGTAMHYQDGKIAFGADLDSRWSLVVKGVKKELERVAQARHWYFHHISGTIDFLAIYDAMEIVADALAGVYRSDEYSPWVSPTVVDRSISIQLTLDTPSPRAPLSVARVREIVGREAEIGVVTALVMSCRGASGSRVLIHGPPGVGKDTVMAEVAHSARVRSLGGLQGWLQASSDVVFRRQLIGLFGVHRSAVVAGTEDNEEAAICAIRHWLSSNTDWVLFIEDAGLGTTTLWEVLPDGVTGRAVVTSQQDLHETHTDFGQAHLELEPITACDSMEMFRKMNVFSRKAPPPPDDEDETALLARCVAAEAGQVFIDAPPTEKARRRKERRRLIETKLFEHAELSRPELRVFFDELLGNLPLSVSLCGHMLRADPDLAGVLDLIALYKHLDLVDVDKQGRNPQQDKHYFGLHHSIRINLDRLMSAANEAEEVRRGAAALLAALSMLHHALTPESLLVGHEMATIFGEGVLVDGLSEQDMAELLPTMAVFMDEDLLRQARDTCVRYGLMRRGECEQSFIGIMHQQVQKGLRQELVADTAAGQGVAQAVRRMLRARFTFFQGMPVAEWSAQRELVPCVSAWCGIVVRGDVHNRSDHSTSLVLEDFGDAHLLNRWGGLALYADGNAGDAEHILTRVVALAKRILPSQHPIIATAMSNLASAQWQLGKSADALLVEERILAERRRDLRPDDPVIGVSMANVSSTLFKLGRFDDAARLGEETVAFMHWVLPQDHPHIAVSIANLAEVYSALGRHEDALRLNEEAFEMRQRILPPDDPDIGMSLNNLTSSYLDLDRFEDAVRVSEQALALNRRVLGQDHPSLAVCMGNLASVYSKIGRHDEALRLKEDVLTMFKRVLPEEHPSVMTAMNNLTTSYVVSGRYHEAAKLGEETLAMRRRILPSDHPDLGTSMINLMSVYSPHLGRHAEAARLGEEALTLWMRVLSPDHRDMEHLRRGLAMVYRRLGRFHDATSVLL